VEVADDQPDQVRAERLARQHRARQSGAAARGHQIPNWCRNLAEHWDECVAEVGEGAARVWGLYMAGSRLAFERNEIQLHHVLATKTDADGVSGYPLRHQFGI
jgi:cyclopropane fatty-acyl-phospholipid synthase-like methyltransferase